LPSLHAKVDEWSHVRIGIGKLSREQSSIHTPTARRAFARMPPVEPRLSMWEGIKDVFLRLSYLGFVGFGGPSVHVILFRRMFVTGKRPWVDATTFAGTPWSPRNARTKLTSRWKDLFSLSGALPGPGSTQLLFSLAIVRAGVLAGIMAFFLWS
jgi:hypothetical protein